MFIFSNKPERLIRSFSKQMPFAFIDLPDTGSTSRNKNGIIADEIDSQRFEEINVSTQVIFRAVTIA